MGLYFTEHFVTSNHFPNWDTLPMVQVTFVFLSYLLS